MSGELAALVAAALTIGFVHAVIGPDHYLPFIALARARRWSLRRTLAITSASGLGHVAGSIVLGALGLWLGWALGGIERFQALRGDIAGWMLVGFGLAYLAWGLRHALRSRPHTHHHVHADGTGHEHEHTHLGHHAHRHPGPSGTRSRLGMGGWSLFVVFVLGPCEPLIPLLMYPAARGRPVGVALVALAFAIATVATMVTLVLVGRAGFALLSPGRWERWSHAAAGGVVAACGVAIQLGL